MDGTWMTRTSRPASVTTSARTERDGRVRLATSACTRPGSVLPASWRGRAPLTRPSSSTPTSSQPSPSSLRLARQTTVSTSSRSEKGRASSPLNSTASVSPPSMSALIPSGVKSPVLRDCRQLPRTLGDHESLPACKQANFRTPHPLPRRTAHPPVPPSAASGHRRSGSSGRPCGPRARGSGPGPGRGPARSAPRRSP